MHANLVSSLLILSLGLVVPALSAAANTPNIHNSEAPGNLESNNTLGCIDAGQVKNSYTPTDLYRAVAACAQSGQYEHGIFLFAIAGTYGRFDTLRVADASAHQAVAVARMMAISNLDDGQRTALQDKLQAMLGQPQGLAATCRQIERIGAPDYYPRYMVQHGMQAFLISDGSDGLVKDFDAPAAWKQALDSYLHCPAA